MGVFEYLRDSFMIKKEHPYKQHGHGYQPTSNGPIEPPPHGGSSIKRLPNKASVIDESAQRIADELTNTFGVPKDSDVDQTLFNNRMELLALLMKTSVTAPMRSRGEFRREIEGILAELMQQVKVYEPPDNNMDISGQQETN